MGPLLETEFEDLQKQFLEMLRLLQKAAAEIAEHREDIAALKKTVVITLLELHDTRERVTFLEELYEGTIPATPRKIRKTETPEAPPKPVTRPTYVDSDSEIVPSTGEIKPRVRARAGMK